MSIRIGVVILGLLVAVTATVAAEEIVVVQSFAPAEVQVTPVDGRHAVALKDGQVGLASIGHPDLPVRTINVAIPRGARGVSVSAEIEEQSIGQGIVVLPCQPQSPPNQPVVVVPPDPLAYALDARAPVVPVAITGTHSMRGRSFVSLQVNPVRYNAAQRELFLITRMTIRVEVERAPVGQAEGPAPAAGKAQAQGKVGDRPRPRRGNEEFDRMFKGMVVNPGFDDEAPAPAPAPADRVPVPDSAPRGQLPSGEVPLAGEQWYLQSSTLSVNENAGTASISVYCTASVTGTIDYTTANGTATAGADYTALSGTLNFAAQSRVALTIPILDDGLGEGNETFTVTISNPSVGTLYVSMPAITTVTIVDNENPGTLKLSASDFSAGETAGTLQATVSRTGGSFGVVTVNYATQNGGALAGADFTSTSGTLSWANGDAANKTITVPLLDDALAEGSEIFYLNLSAVTGGATLGSPASAAATIVDNEVNPNAADYLIITNDALKPTFQVLADHRANHNGFVTKVVTVAYIVATYPGADDQQKIRNFIKACVTDSGTQYVVLGGDNTVVKDRDCYVSCGSYEEPHMPTDLYYAGLDGTWNSDGDGTYGEAGQDTDVDLAIDVMVGRIPVQTAGQAAAYIAKLLAYDGTPPVAIARKMMIGGEKLWDSYSATSYAGGEGRPNDDVTGDGHRAFRDANHPTVSDGEMWMRRSYRNYVQAFGWQPTQFSIMYDTLTSWDGAGASGSYPASGPNVASRLSEDGGYNFLLVYTHGGNNVWAFEGTYFNTSHAAGLTGAANFVYTDACLTGGFDAGEPCLSEAMLRNPTGGSLVYLGCSRYGWGGPDPNPADATSNGGSSAYCMNLWLDEVFNKKNLDSGVAFFNHKARFAGSCSYNGSYRWIQFGLNFQGDPALKIIGVQPFVSVTASTTAKGEGEGGTVAITFRRCGAANSSDLTVNYTRSGTAASGADYTTSPALASSGSITIPAGADAVTVNLTVINDALVEGDESVIVEVSPGADYMADSLASTQLIIVDNDNVVVPTVRLAVVDSVAREQGPDPGVIRVWRTGSCSTAITVPYSIAGTAGNGTDYAPLSGSVSLPANIASVDIIVLPIDDTVGDIGETVVLSAQAGAGYVLGASTGGTLTIEDNDMTVTVAAQDANASEPGRGDGNGNFRFSRSGAITLPATIHFTVSGTASAGDYAALGGTVTFAANQTSVDLSVVPADDGASEPRESVILTLISDPVVPTAYSIGTPGAATVFIHDDDLPVIAVETSANTFAEADGSKTAWTLRRIKGNQNTALTVNYTLGGAAVGGTDYTSLPGTATIAANSTAETTAVNLNVDPTQDTVCEGPETAIVTLAADAAYAIEAGAASGTIIINDDDKPTVAITATTQISEGSTGTVTITRSNDLVLDQVTVLYAVTGTATALADYAALSGSLIIPQHETSASFTVSALADSIPEPGETLIVTISANAAYAVAVSPGNSATATIIDDDETPLVTVTASDGTASEPGRSDGPGVLRFQRAGDRSAAITVNYLVGGSATAGTDYQTLAGSVTIPAGSDVVDVAVTPLDDSEAETDENVVVSLLPGAGYLVGTPVAATVNLYDDETPQVFVTVSDATCKEAGTADPGRFRFSRLGNRGPALSLTYAVTGTASNGTDYAAVTSPFALGANSTSGELTITPLNDALVEGSETVILTLAAGGGYTLAAPSSAMLYIQDDETVDVSLSVPDGSAIEGSSDKGTFRITRSATATTSLTVLYTVGGTATPGADYASLSGTATIPANATTVDITVDASACNDGLSEGAEAVVVTLGFNNGVNLYDITSGPATVLIRDDETPTITLAATDSSATEEGDTGTFTVTAAPAPTSNLTVNLTVSGSAAAGSDYLALPASVVILAGQTSATLTVTPFDDDLYEGSGGETVVLTLAAGAYNLGTPNAGTVTIDDNGDKPVITVVAIDASATEAGPTTGKFLLVASKAASASYNVLYTVSGTATVTADYAAIGTSKTISANAFQADILVTPVNDALAEGPESVVVALAADTRYAIGTPASATVTIADDDASSPGTLAFGSAAFSQSEGDSGSAPAIITVSRSGGSTGSVSVSYATAGGTATAGSDFTATSGTLTWADGEAGDKTFSVSVIGDYRDESNETVALTLGSPTGGASLGTAAATLTITDDDTAGVALGTVSGQTTENGGTATFAVALASQPTAAVTIGLSSSDTGEGTVSPASLTFTTGNWNVAQTVTVTGVDDVIADGAVAFTVVTAAAGSADAAYNGFNAADVAVVNADDAVALTVTAGTGGTVSPSGTVQADPDGSTAVVATPVAGYGFVNWTGNTAGMASTTAASTTIQPTVAQAIQANFVANVVTIVASPTAVQVPEGGTATFQVQLSAQPTATVTVAVARASGDTDLTVSGSASLDFTTTNWNVAQQVTLAAAADVDTTDGVALFDCTATGLVTVTATATEEDDDTALLTLALAPGSISEAGGTATATVTRVGGPTGALTVTLASSDLSEATVPASVILPDGMASVTFTISAVDDALVDGTQTATISATAVGLSPGSATVAVTDDDVVGITVGGISGQTTESGGTATFTVVLRSQPTAGVTIVLSSSDASEGTVSPTSLPFTVGNWNVAQTVTVTGVDDAIADGSIAFTIVTAAASSADAAYNGLDAANVAVVNADDAVALTVTAGAGGTVSPSGTMQADPDGPTAVVATPADGYLFVDWTGDTAGMASTTAASTTIQPTVVQAIQANFVLNTVSIIASTATVSVPEGGTAGFQVRLSAAPAASVTVAVARASGDSDITVTGGASLVFTPANWNTPQAVQLSAAEDDGDQAAGAATIACTATGLATATVTANEVDDERALTITTVNGTVTRTPATPWYDHGSSVELTAVPATGYHFTGWSGALSGSANPATLVMDGDKAVTANFALNVVAIEAAPVTVGVPEGGTTTFQLRLSAQPVANVTVALAKVGDADLAIASAPSLLFTTVNWGAYQTVTLTAAEDDADQAAGSATISCSAAGLTTVTVTANEVDDDHTLTLSASHGSISAAPATALYDHGSSVTLTAVADAGYHFTGWSGGLTGSVNPSTLVMDADKSVTASFAANVVSVEVDAVLVSVPEGGTAGFQVRLSAQPATDVTVNVARTAGDADLSVAAGAVLTFTSVNWQTWQGVTLAAAEDLDVINGSATITCNGGACGSPTVQAVEADNDEVNLVVDSAVVAVPEGGTAGFRVRLSQLPTADVAVTVARSAGDSDITVSGGATLTFTIANWATWQNVTLAAAEDDGDMLAGAATISCSAALLDPVTVSANEVDDDHALAITAVNGTATKAPASAYHDHGSSVVLTATPDTGFHFTGWSGALGGSVNPANLLMDADKAVTAHFVANDVAILAAASVVVPENGTASLAVRLSAQPSGPVTVAVSASGDPDVVVQAGASLVFDSLDWDVSQTVTLAALDDADALDGGATITCAAAALASVTVAATEDDDDVAALTLTLAQSTVGEAAGLVSATVSRNTAASGMLLVTLGSSLPAEATVPASVTIPAGASSASFSIAVIDDLVVDGTQTTLISTTASGHATASASLQITDNDTAGFVVAPTSLHVAEAGGTATFSVVLSAKPLTSVRLLLSSSALGEATVAPAVLLIDPATWDTPRVVTVTGVDDAVFGAGTATITIAMDDASSDDAFDALADQQVAITCDDNEVNFAPTIAVVSPVGAAAVIPDGLGLRIDTTVADDGLPGAPAVLTVSWSQVSGPGSATFDCLSCEDVRVGFSGPGVYVLRLSATDGLLTTTQDVTVTVDNGGGPYANLAPLVSAGPDAAGAAGSPIALAGSASDDGNPTGTLTLSWSQVLGSGLAVFSAPSSAVTNVTCPLPGSYIFRLTADDGAVQTCDEVQVTVSATYLLTVLNDGHCTTVPAGASVQTTGIPVSISATPASGWHFNAWIVVSGPALFADWQDASTTVTATADAVIRATCAINTYTLAYNAGLGGSVSGLTVQTVAYGGSGAAVTAVPVAGYHFVAWSDGVATASRSDGPITANLTVFATFAANAVAICSNASVLSITEGGSRTQRVWLSDQPVSDVTVNVAHAAGDADIIVAGGATLLFTTANWNIPQTALLAALDDPDLSNGSAQISLSAVGLATVVVTAYEYDDDAAQSVTVGSNNPGGGGCGAGGLGLLLVSAFFGLALRRRVRGGGR